MAKVYIEGKTPEEVKALYEENKESFAAEAPITERLQLNRKAQEWVVIGYRMIVEEA